MRVIYLDLLSIGKPCIPKKITKPHIQQPGIVKFVAHLYYNLNNLESLWPHEPEHLIGTNAVNEECAAKILNPKKS